MRNPGDQLADALRAWRAGRGPLYRQLADAIVALAEAGSLEHGMRLPSERALAERLRVSRNTVTAAYQRLQDIGWLEVRRDIDFARAVTEHLRAQGIAAEPDEVVVTSGGQQAVWLAVTSIGGAPPVIALEAVTYPGVFDAIQAVGGKPLALPMGPDGLDAAQAVALIEAAGSAIADEELDWQYRAPAGGPCLWLRLPGGSGERFAQRAAAAGAPVAPGSAFEALPGVATDRFRLPYYLPAQEMQRGIKLLADHAQ